MTINKNRTLIELSVDKPQKTTLRQKEDSLTVNYIDIYRILTISFKIKKETVMELL